MLVELGFIPPASVSLPPLPGDAPRTAVVTWQAVEALLQVRCLTAPLTEPFTFSAPWVAAAYGIEEKHVRSGKLWLARHGFLVKVGECPGRGRPADLWIVAAGRVYRGRGDCPARRRDFDWVGYLGPPVIRVESS